MVVAATAGMRQTGSLRKATGACPNILATTAASPPSGISTRRQISVTTVTDSTVEAKKIARRIAAQREALFSTSASSNPITASAGTVSSTK